MVTVLGVLVGVLALGVPLLLVLLDGLTFLLVLHNTI